MVCDISEQIYGNSNHRYNIEMLIKLHNIFKKLGIMYGMLSFNDTSI